ncbi:MAG: hypothetical protein QOH61_181 [Chloroflexota bacterium]|nr:hypothetical protein [Chloroflexota bacterium]
MNIVEDVSVGNVRLVLGDLFESRAQTLVNTVNCVGIMGAGVALGFKKRFPDMYREYVKRCERGEMRLGHPYLWSPIIPPWVLNFPTKDHWKSRTRREDLTAGLAYLEAHYREWGITSLAVPPLGSGLGGLEWRIVGPTLYRGLSRLDVPVELFAPPGTPAEELEPGFLGGAVRTMSADLRVSPAAIAIADIVKRLSRQPYGAPVGRTTFVKLAYFATEAGIPTNLTFAEGSFGPYAADLATVTRKLFNNGVLEERTLGQMQAARPGPSFDDALVMYQPFLAQWDDRIERVVDLFMRLRSTRQAEVAATVHYAAKVLRERRGEDPSEMEVLTYVRKWKERRKPPLLDDELAHAIRSLRRVGWLRLKESKGLPVPAG